jgi:hypothetical protein
MLQLSASIEVEPIVIDALKHYPIYPQVFHKDIRCHEGILYSLSNFEIQSDSPTLIQINCQKALRF